MSLETVYAGYGIAKLFEKYIYPWMKKHGPFKIWIIWTSINVIIWLIIYLSTAPANRHGLGGLWMSLINPVLLFLLFLYAIKYVQEKREREGRDIVEPVPLKTKQIRVIVAVAVAFVEIVLFATYAFMKPITVTLVNISGSARFFVFLITFLTLAIPTILALRAHYSPKRPKGFGAYIFIVIMYSAIAGMFNMALVYPNFVESHNTPKKIGTEQTADIEILEAEIKVTHSSSSSNETRYYKKNYVKLIYDSTTYSINVNDSIMESLPNGSAVCGRANVALFAKEVFSQKIFAGKAQMHYVEGRMGYPCVLGFIAADSANTLPPDHRIEDMKKQQNAIMNIMLDYINNSATKTDSTIKTE